MRAILAVSVVALALAGCGKKEGASADATTPVKREAGLWKSDMKLTKFDMPGAPPEMKQMMEGMLGKIKGVESCLTAEEAAKEDLAQKLAKPPGDNGQCTYQKKDVKGGTMDIVMVCNDPQTKEPMTVSMKGTASPKKTEMTLVVSGKQAGQPMSMEMIATNSWVSACKS